MPIQIADSNFLGKTELCGYLSASTSNRIALSEEVMVEMHKSEPTFDVRASLAIARNYPEQIIVLRSVTQIYAMPVHSAADARKLIDQRQTAAFAQWYDDVLRFGHDKDVADSLATAKKQAQSRIDEIAAAVQHIQPIFQNMKKQFDKNELKQMRDRVPYSHGTQKKLFDLIYAISRTLFKKSGVPESLYPKFESFAFRYFIFRYAMCMTLLYTRWISCGNFSDDTSKLVNHVMDMHLVALGTFFGGVLSGDKMLVDVHREARFLLRVSGKAYLG